MKTERIISYVKGTVRAQGNGAHVMVPKEWIGQDVHVIPLKTLDEAAIAEHMKAFHGVHIRRGRRKR
jgi:putative transposon-encoded protein